MTKDAGPSVLSQVVSEKDTCSVHPLSGSSRVNFLEGGTCALVKNCLGFEAKILIISVGTHAYSERLKIDFTELLEDVLTWRVFVFSCETMEKKNVRINWGRC